MLMALRSASSLMSVNDGVNEFGESVRSNDSSEEANIAVSYEGGTDPRIMH